MMLDLLVFFAELFALALLVMALALVLFIVIAWIEDGGLPTDRRFW